jgi:hypothetical protein
MEVGSSLTVPVYVARKREPLRLSRADLDARFPGALPSKVRNICKLTHISIINVLESVT